MSDAGTEGHGRWGAWRAIAAGPSIVCSAIVVLVATDGLGRWAVLACVGWLGCGAFTLSRTGERWVVRIGWGFRRPGPAGRALLEPVWLEVLERTGVLESAVDLYVQAGRAVNAYAVGGRSVAVSAPLLNAYRDGRLDRAGLAAVLAHEVGHHDTHGARYVPLVLWLTLPWRVLCRVLIRVGYRLVGSQPVVPLAAVGLVAVLVGGVQLVRDRSWGAVVLVVVVLVAAAVSPLVDAAVSRAAEFAADRYAARVGYAADLAHVLRRFDGEGQSRTVGARLLERHPAARDRASRLDRAVELSGSPPAVRPASLVR